MRKVWFGQISLSLKFGKDLSSGCGDIPHLNDFQGIWWGGWVGGWVDEVVGWVYGMIIIPLRGPSCKLRFARIQLG